MTELAPENTGEMLDERVDAVSDAFLAVDPEAIDEELEDPIEPMDV